MLEKFTVFISNLQGKLSVPMTRSARALEVVVIGVHFVFEAVAVGGFLNQCVVVIKRPNRAERDQDKQECDA
jgi:hypothetical protein